MSECVSNVDVVSTVESDEHMMVLSCGRHKGILLDDLRTQLSGGSAANPFALNFRDFGAQGNGQDDTDAFARLITRINALGNCIVYVPSGTYKISGTHTINNRVGVTFMGVDPLFSIFKYTGTGTFISVSQSTDIFGSQIRFVDMAIHGSSTSPWDNTAGHDQTSIGVLMAGTRQGGLLLDNCEFRYWGQACISLNDVTFAEINHTFFIDSKRGVAGGYKTDLFTVINSFAYQCDIGFDLGYWDPDHVAGGITQPFGPTTVNFISCGASSCRIGAVIGGMEVSGVVFHGWYGEFNSQCMVMIGHSSGETWFLDGTRNTAQKQDVANEYFGTRVKFIGCHSLSNEANIHVYRYGQYFIESFTGSGDDATDAVIEMKTAYADQSRVEIKDSWSPGIKFSDNSTVATLPEGDYPLRPIVIAGAANSTPLTAGDYTNIALDTEIVDSHGMFDPATGVATMRQAGIISIVAGIQGTVGFAGQEIVLFVLKNGALGDRITGKVAAASALALEVTGSIEIQVAKGDTIGLRAYQSSGSTVNTYAPLTRFSLSYKRGPNNTPL